MPDQPRDPNPSPMDTLSINFDDVGASQPVTPRTDQALYRVPMAINASSSASTPCRVTTTSLGSSFDSAIAPLFPPYPAVEDEPPPPASVFSIAVPPPPNADQSQQQSTQQRQLNGRQQRRVSQVPLHPRDACNQDEDEAMKKKRTTYILIAAFVIVLVIFIVAVVLYSL